MSEVRPLPFTQSINASIERVLDTELPADKHGAVVFFADGNKVSGAVIARTEFGLSFVCKAEKQWDSKRIEGEAALAWSW